MEIDPERLGRLVDLDTVAGREALDALLRAYARDARSRLLQLREHARAGTRGEVRRQAHQLKGSCAMIGATRLAALFEHVEAAALDGAADLDEPIAAAERVLEIAVGEIASRLGEQV